MKWSRADQIKTVSNRKNNCKTRIKMTKSLENWKTMIYKRFPVLASFTDF